MSTADVRIPGATSQTVLGAWGLFTAVLLVMLGNGMLGTLLGIRAEIEGFSTTTTGVVLAGYFTGFLAGSWAVPRFVVSVGHIRTYAALASLTSTAALVHILTPNPVAWGVARLVTGFAMCGLYIVAESWLNDVATNENRGRLLSVYMIVVMGGIALSQLLLTAADPAGIVLFIIASVLVSVAVIPITLSVSPAPEFRLTQRLSVRKVWDAAPLGLAAGFGQGVAVGAWVSLGAVFGARVGMSIGRIAVFMATAVIGSVVLQTPIGVISDRVRRRGAILAVALLASGFAMLLTVTDPLSSTAFLFVFLLGGMIFPMYSLALSHINDHVPPGSAVSVSSVYLFFTGTGAIVGPIAAAVVIDAVGPEGLFWLIAAMNLAIALFALLRITIREGLPVERQREYTMVPARAGTVIMQVARRIRPPRGGRG